jgi:ankyrin repeat protein
VLDTQQCYGYTSLHWAACKGHAGTVRLLVEMGSDIHARAKDGSTPLHIAASSEGYVEDSKGAAGVRGQRVIT